MCDESVRKLFKALSYTELYTYSVKLTISKHILPYLKYGEVNTADARICGCLKFLLMVTATQHWILQRLHHKPDVELKGFLFIKKTNIENDKNTRFFITFIFFHEPVMKQGHFIALLLNYAKSTVL